MASASIEGNGQTLADFDDELKSIRGQFSEQLKSMGARTSRKLEMARDFNGYFQKLAEIEGTYASSLEKLHEKFSQPRKSGMQAMASKLQWRGNTSEDSLPVDVTLEPTKPTEATGLTTDVWTILLEQTKRKAESRQQYASKLGTGVRATLDSLEREVAATSKKCLELGGLLQDDMQKNFKSLESMMKAYHSHQSTALKAEEKFDKAQEKGQAASKKGEKLREKFVSAEKKATQMRNEYLMSLAASNAFKKQYYKHELGALADVMDRHYHDTLRGVVVSFKELCLEADQTSMDTVAKVHSGAEVIDQTRDKVKFFNDYQMIFMDRQLFEFLRFNSDQINSIQYASESLGELSLRYKELESQIFVLEQSIGQEHETLKAIGHMEEGAAQDKGPEDLVVKTAVMYTECYQKIATKRCLKTAAQAQLNCLGEALGSHRPEPREFDGGFTVKFGESIEPPLDTRGFDGSLKRGSVRSQQFGRSRTTESVSDGLRPERTPSKDQGSEAAGNGAQDSAAGQEEDGQSDGSFEGLSPPGTPDLPRGIDLAGAERIKERPKEMQEKQERANSLASELKQRKHSASGPPVSKKPNRKSTSDLTTGAATAAAAAAAAGKGKGKGKGKDEEQDRASKPSRPPPFKKGEGSPAPAPRPRLESALPLDPEMKRHYKFGCNLAASNQTLGGSIPLCVEACINALEDTGMRDEGLFRVPGSSSQIQELRVAFENGRNPLVGEGRAEFSNESIAGCLKLFLRELEDPVMTRKLYPAFVQIGRLVKNRRQQVLALRESMQDHMPADHRNLLAMLMPFLKRVAQLAEHNRMSTSNLALVFGPTLMPAPKGDMTAMLRDANPISVVMTTLIDSHGVIFGDDEPPPDELAPPEPEPEPLVVIGQARAKFDYEARSEKELSFKAGDFIDVYDKADVNWWNGTLDGREGFIAAAYVVEWDDEKQAAYEERQRLGIASPAATPNPKAARPSIDTAPSGSPPLPSSPLSSIQSQSSAASSPGKAAGSGSRPPSVPQSPTRKLAPLRLEDSLSGVADTDDPADGPEPLSPALPPPPSIVPPVLPPPPGGVGGASSLAPGAPSATGRRPSGPPPKGPPPMGPPPGGAPPSGPPATTPPTGPPPSAAGAAAVPDLMTPPPPLSDEYLTIAGENLPPPPAADTGNCDLPPSPPKEPASKLVRTFSTGPSFAPPPPPPPGGDDELASLPPPPVDLDDLPPPPM